MKKTKSILDLLASDKLLEAMTKNVVPQCHAMNGDHQCRDSAGHSGTHYFRLSEPPQ